MWSAGQIKEWLEKQQKQEGFAGIEFMIHTLEDDKAIGFIELDGISWHKGKRWDLIFMGLMREEFFDSRHLPYSSDQGTRTRPDTPCQALSA
jgi:hypothetical protein